MTVQLPKEGNVLLPSGEEISEFDLIETRMTWMQHNYALCCEIARNQYDDIYEAEVASISSLGELDRRAMFIEPGASFTHSASLKGVFTTLEAAQTAVANNL